MPFKMGGLYPIHALINIVASADWVKVYEFLRKFIKDVDSAIEKLQSIELDKFQLEKYIRKCEEKLEDAGNYAKRLMTRVKRLFDFADLGNRKFQYMEKSIERKKLKSVQDYIYLLNNYLTKAYNSYEDFIKAFNDAKTACSYKI